VSFSGGGSELGGMAGRDRRSVIPQRIADRKGEKINTQAGNGGVNTENDEHQYAKNDRKNDPRPTKTKANRKTKFPPQLPKKHTETGAGKGKKTPPKKKEPSIPPGGENRNERR